MAFLLLFCEHHFFASIIAICAMMNFPPREVFELKQNNRQADKCNFPQVYFRMQRILFVDRTGKIGQR